MASGFLSGKYHKEEDLVKSARGGGLKKYLNAKGMNTLAALDKIADKHSTSPATIATAWVLAQPAVTAPIVSASHSEQLASLLAAPHIALDKDDLNLLDNIH